MTHASRRSRGKGRSRSDESKGASSGELHGYRGAFNKQKNGIDGLFGLSSSRRIHTHTFKDLFPGDLGKVNLRSYLYYIPSTNFIPRFHFVYPRCMVQRNFLFIMKSCKWGVNRLAMSILRMPRQHFARIEERLTSVIREPWSWC